MLAPPATDHPLQVNAGLASLTFGIRDGRTTLLRSRVRPPLLVQRALYLDDALPEMAFAFLANPTAGILEGDEYTVEVDLGAGCQAHVCTQAATKVFSMPSGCAVQRVSLKAQEAAYLEHLPDAIIPFHNARLSQETVIQVAPGATVIFGETICPGRVEMGESFAFDHWRSRLTVTATDGSPLYQEAFFLAPKIYHPLRTGVMGRFTAPSLGTLLVLNDDDDIDPRVLRDGINTGVGKLIIQGVNARAGVSLLPNEVGVGVKVLGEPASAVAKVMHAAWAEARRQLLGVDLPSLRKF